MTNQHSTGYDGADLLTELVAAVRRRWRLLTTPPVPEHQGPARLDPRALRLHRLERTLDLLEATRHRIGESGWVGGGWMASIRPAAGVPLAGAAEIRALLAAPGRAGAACLVGTMLLLADDQDTAHTIDDVWRATDALYESVHERAGHTGGRAAGHVFAPAERRVHLRALTAWNDEPGRRAGDVVDLLNRSISRTIAACVV